MQKEISQKENTFQLEVKSFQELDNDPIFNKALQSLVPIKKENISSQRTVMEEQYGFTIDSTTIKEITIDNLISYTMLIHRDTIDTSFFENLVITTDNINTPKAFLIKYNLSSQPIYIAEDNAYAIDAEAKITQIDYNITDAKISYTDGDGCMVLLMCPEGGSDHPAGGNCIDADRGNLFWETTCPSSGGGESSSTSSGSPPSSGSGNVGGGTSTTTDPPITSPIFCTGNCIEEEEPEKPCSKSEETIAKLEALLNNADIATGLTDLENHLASGVTIENGWEFVQNTSGGYDPVAPTSLGYSETEFQNPPPTGSKLRIHVHHNELIPVPTWQDTFSQFPQYYHQTNDADVVDMLLTETGLYV